MDLAQLGAKLCALRRERGESIDDVAERMEVSADDIRAVERGEDSVSVGLLDDYARHSHIDLLWGFAIHRPPRPRADGDDVEETWQVRATFDLEAR